MTIVIRLTPGMRRWDLSYSVDYSTQTADPDGRRVTLGIYIPNSRRRLETSLTAQSSQETVGARTTQPTRGGNERTAPHLVDFHT